MPRISPVPNCNREGFTLIEVIVATAVVALMISAAASTVVAARSASLASDFFRQAFSEAETIQVEAIGIVHDETHHRLANETETITSDPAGAIPAWRMVTLRAANGNRSATFALDARGLP